MRVTGTYGSDERSRGGGRPNVVNLHVPDATVDADIIAIFTAIEAITNAKLVSVKREIANNGYNDLPEGLPGDIAKVLYKNNITGAIDQVSWVFAKPGTTDAQIKAIFDNPLLRNRYGDDLGTLLKYDHTPLSEE